MLISLSNVTNAEAHWLEEALHRTFGAFNREFLDAMKPELHWVRLAAGTTLFEQGASEDALYFVVAGRLRAIQRDPQGKERAIGDIRRGETLGEMALLTGEPRSARVIAIRDSLLVQLSRQSYEKVIRVYPLVSLHVSRFIVERLRRANDPRLSWARSGTVAVLPLSRSARCADLTQRLLPLMARHGRVECLDEQRLAAEMGVTEGGGSPIAADRWQQVSRWVDEREAASDLVLLSSENPDSQWTLQCAAHADEILWIANAEDADLHATAQSGLITARSGTLARQTLLLVHPADTRVPRHTSRWLDRFPTDTHLHLRRDHAPDMARLSRTLMGRSTGVVFGGGGARGFAHLGVMKAL
jgi:NTE family protein